MHTSETSVDEAKSICKRNTRSATVASCSPAFPRSPKRPAPGTGGTAPVPVLHISRSGPDGTNGDGARVAVPASSWPARRSHWPMEADESECAARGAPPALLPVPPRRLGRVRAAGEAKSVALRVCYKPSRSPSASESRYGRHRMGVRVHRNRTSAQRSRCAAQGAVESQRRSPQSARCRTR